MVRERNAWKEGWKIRKGETKGVLLLSAKGVADDRMTGEINGGIAVQWGTRG